MRGESDPASVLGSALAVEDPPKEQPPGNSQVKELSYVSTLESGTAVTTDGESRQMTRRDVDVGRRGGIEATAAA